MKTMLKLIACKPIPAGPSGVPTLIMPWGESLREDGIRLVVDDLAARSIKSRFDQLGRDVVVDYEHQTLGGEWGAPNGKAPAAGWMKAGTMEIRPGRGIFCKIEWTPEALREILNKQYRFLSPVVYYDQKTGRVFEVRCAGLTNDPALKMPVLANSRNAVIYREVVMNGTGLASQLKDLLKMGQDADALEIVTKIREVAAQIQNGETAPPEGAAVIEAMAALLADKMGSDDTREELSNNRRGGSRRTIIANARARHARERAAGLKLLGDERSYVDGALREAGQVRLSDEEARRLSIQNQR